MTEETFAIQANVDAILSKAIAMLGRDHVDGIFSIDAIYSSNAKADRDKELIAVIREEYHAD